MVEMIRSVSVTNPAYTRAGATINVTPYKDTNGWSSAGNFGCGIHGYKYVGASGYNRYHPLWIAGDGQTSPTNGVAIWTLRDQGLASHGFGCFTSQLITFDTQKIRSYLLNGTSNTLRLTGRYGMLGENGSGDYRTTIGGVWVDGVSRFISPPKQTMNASSGFNLLLETGDRYVTLALLNNTYWSANGVFKDVILTVLPGGTMIGVK